MLDMAVILPVRAARNKPKMLGQVHSIREKSSRMRGCICQHALRVRYPDFPAFDLFSLHPR